MAQILSKEVRTRIMQKGEGVIYLSLRQTSNEKALQVSEFVGLV